MDEPIKREDPHGFLAGLVIGVLAGGAAALLLSPKNGKEMRGALKDFAEEWKDEAAELSEDVKAILSQFQEALEEGVSEVREMTQKPVARTAGQVEQMGKEAQSTIGQKYEEARDSVQEMINSWRQSQLEPSRYTQPPVREVSPRREAESPASDDWPTYPTTSDDYYHNFKGGSVSAVAEPEVETKREASPIESGPSVKGEENNHKVDTVPMEKSAAPKSPPEFGRDYREPEGVQPFLAPRPEEIKAKEEASQPVAAKPAVGISTNHFVGDEVIDIPSFKRMPRVTEKEAEPAGAAEDAAKPGRKLFFKRK